MGPVRRIAAVLVAVLAAMAPVAGAGPAAADADGADAGVMAAPQISIGTHNTWYGNASFERFAGVIGWQEVNDSAARDKLRNRLGAEYTTFWPADDPARSVPISWRGERFALVNSGSIRTHDGEAGVTPARYVNWVILQVRGTDSRFIVVNTHFISGAWSGHPERQARWNQHWDVLRDKVADLRQNHPAKPVFVIGDFNRHLAMTMPTPIRFVPVQDAGGAVPLDHMYAPTTVEHSQVLRQPKWGSDHHAYLLHTTV